MSQDFTETRTQTHAATAAATGSARTLVPGSIFGSYRIQHVLGEGGMGRVYQAEQLDSGRIVALKLLHQAAPSPKERDRFLREGRIAASISHPNSVFVFGTEEIAGVPVIVMELIAGGTLKDKLAASGPLPVQDAVTSIVQVLNGLEAAHAAGILHRDIKPSNCFVEPDGTIKLGDFGISRPSHAIDAPGSSTFTLGSFAGTPAYAPPEQLDGAALNARSDIYAIGATLYHLLTGRPPFEQRELVQLVAAVIGKAPDPPTAIRSDIPKALSDIVLKCLAKKPQDRYASATELRNALERTIYRTEPGKDKAKLAEELDRGPFSLLLLVTVLDGPQPLIWTLAGLCLITASAYAYWEGCFGITPAKYLLGLRETRRYGEPLGILPRSLYWSLMLLAYVAVTYFMRPGSERTRVAPLLLCAVAFIFLNRRSLWRTELHLLSPVASLPAPGARDLPRDATSSARLGPYRLEEQVADAAGQAVWKGWDDTIQRPVWIVRTSESNPRTSPQRQELRSLTRLRWLNGRRQPDESWDAFEYRPGGPLPAELPNQDFKLLIRWLIQIAEEVGARPRDNSLFSLERIWIDAANNAVLLDFPHTAPELPVPALEHLLHAIACQYDVHLPSSGAPARLMEFVRSLLVYPARKSLVADPVISALKACLDPVPAAINRTTRAASLLVMLLLPVALIIGFGGRNVIRELNWVASTIRKSPPQRAELWRDFAATEYRAELTNANHQLPADLVKELLSRPPGDRRADAIQNMRVTVQLESMSGPAVLIATLFILFVPHEHRKKLGLLVVRGSGQRAPNWLLAIRGTLCIGPFVACEALLLFKPEFRWTVYPLCVAVLTGLAFSLWKPNRAPVDYLLGTYIVPE